MQVQTHPVPTPAAHSSVSVNFSLSQASATSLSTASPPTTMASEPKAPEIQIQAESGLLAAISPSRFYQPLPKPTENKARKTISYETRCPFSRATRVILAVDLNKGELPFRKNYCRVHVDGMEEGKTYRLMQGKNVPHINRMTLDVVGRSLTDFKSSYHFISAIADAMEGKF
jgi:hypothetical protein